ncbi:odorant receptor 63a-like [Haematobia irritans]|uniref:odorant receptor 63a-like n=1 Tax=Haematobia irritans TaxID=7368 RepID=UPI003F507A21
MSQDLRAMLFEKQLENNKMLNIFYKISFMTGVNIKYQAKFKDPVKLWNIFLIIISMIGLCAQYCLVWHNRYAPFVESADAICTANQAWISILKLIYLLFVQHQFYDLLHTAINGSLLYDLEIFDLAITCKQYLLSKITAILDDSWLHIKHQLNFFSFSCMTACGFYMFSCIAANYYYTHIQPQNFTLQLPMPALFPMWHDYGMTWPYYPIQYFITGIENSICGMCAVCFDGIFIVIVVHCSSLLEILHELLEHATDDEVPQTERVKYLLCCARLHERIFRYYEKINFMYRTPSLAQCVLSMLVLCVVMFMANVGLEEDLTLFIKMLCFLCAAGLQIAIYCYNGQKIITQSENTPVAWYSCSWYNESKQFKYIINMMVLRTNRTLYLQVSGFTTMSLMTLVSIVQTSGSYFLLLKNLSGMD